MKLLMGFLLAFNLYMVPIAYETDYCKDLRLKDHFFLILSMHVYKYNNSDPTLRPVANSCYKYLLNIVF